MKKSESENTNQQIKYYAEIFVKKYEKEFPKLNYSLESLKIIDRIIQTKTAQDFEIREIAFYFLETLRKNTSMEIIWNRFTQEPIVIFKNFNEFYVYQHIEEQIENNGKNNSLKTVNKLLEKNN